MSKISIIVAVADDGSIGKDLELLWRLPADMKHFKNLTTGHTILMGRKTFESLPKGALPNRKNVVVSTSKDMEFKDCYVYDSLLEALETHSDDGEIFIIGGATIYKQTLPYANKIYLTRVHSTFPEANIHFPELNLDEWTITEQELHKADEKNPFDYDFVTLERKK
jgi:dihydrofolate reductase